MSHAAIIPERLAELPGLTLNHGNHRLFEHGHCAMEVVAWLAGEGHTDAPQCASPVLRGYTIRLNDRWDDEKRQSLAPYLPRMVGTGGDGLDGERSKIATRFLLDKLLEPWFRLAGMDAEADQIPSVLTMGYTDQRRIIRDWTDAAWKLRSVRRAELRDKIKKHLVTAHKPAAVAAAVADAAAVAVAVAAADAAAVADAAADAAAVAAADAAADADADADAAADAVAVAVADADAADPWGASYNAAYSAARAYYREHPEIFQRIYDLNQAQEPFALELLDAMILDGKS